MRVRTLIVLVAPWFGATFSAAAIPDPAELPRAEICLNGTWETVLNAGGESVPASGWSPRRAPALPLAAGDPRVSSAWYRQRLRIPRSWIRPQRRFVLTLDKVGHYCAIYCNGRFVAEHHGQFTPFAADITDFLHPAELQEIALFVHDASGKYVRPGVVLDDPREGLAYRGATDRPEQRNWVGVVGDMKLSWHPATSINDLQVLPSVRKKTLEVRVDTIGIDPGRGPLVLRAAVLDNGKPVLPMPERPLNENGTTSLVADWGNPVLWGPAPYGRPKLYNLRTELLQNGAVVDRRFTRFGFREVWVEGRDVLLNGTKLWMAGTYYGKLMPLRYLNDRHPQAMAIEVMQASGLNTLHGHWDDLGAPWLDRCDELGMLVLGGFYCDGRPQIQSRADPGWEDWMADTCANWARSVRNHPSIVIWRPMDIGPVNVMSRGRTLFNRLADRVKREDGSRPFAFGNDGSEIDSWAQSPLKDQRDKTVFDDGFRLAARFKDSPKPFLTKEIYTGFADVDSLSRFFRVFYEKSFALGGTGLVVQHLPLITRSRPFAIEWLSQSGLGNRDTAPVVSPGNLPNWSDASQPVWTASPYSALFRELYTRYMKQAPEPVPGFRPAELLVSGLAADDLALLVPQDPAATETVGVRAASDGTAWIVPRQTGEFQLFHAAGSQPILTRRLRGQRTPGYGDVSRVEILR